MSDNKEVLSKRAQPSNEPNQVSNKKVKLPDCILLEEAAIEEDVTSSELAILQMNYLKNTLSCGVCKDAFKDAQVGHRPFFQVTERVLNRK